MQLPLDYYTLRTRRALERLEALGKAQAMLVSLSENVAYLSGFAGGDSWLVIGAGGGRWLVTDSRYAEQAAGQAKDYRVVLRDGSTVFETLKSLLLRNKIKSLCFESQAVSYQFFHKLKETIQPVDLIATSGIIESLREQKDRLEMQKIQKAIDITTGVFEGLKKFIKVGMTERQIQNEFEYRSKAAGAEKTSFDVIVAFGSASSMPHYSTNRRIIGSGKPLLMDMGVVFEGYSSDLTRNLFFGKIPALYLRTYRAVLEAQQAAIRTVVTGVEVRRVDEVCRKVLKRYRLEKFFAHSTGHGVGLQVHESPSVSRLSEARLREGMVITIEPGVYLARRFGIRIEDMLCVGSKTSRVLTAAADRSPEGLRIG